MSHREPSIAKDLLSYWMEYPEAQDTLEGIAEWWLLERYLRRQLAAVRRALAELVERGFVTEVRGGDARVRYRLNGERMTEIEGFLGAGPDEPPSSAANGTEASDDGEERERFRS